MTAKTAAIDIKISGITEASKDQEDLRKKLKQLKLELAGLDEGSEEFKKIAKEAGQLTDHLGDLDILVNTLASDTRKLDTFLSIGEGIAGGFAAAQGAIGLFTDENEELQKATLKVQSAMSLLNGVQAVANTLNKSSAASINLLSGAQKAYAVAVGATSGVLKTFRLALIGTGIGAIIVSVGLLIANFEKVKSVILDLFPPLNKLGGLVTWVTDLFTSSSEKIQETANKEVKTLERKIELQKAKGKETIELEKQLADERIKSFEKGSDEYLDAIHQKEVLLATFEKQAADKRINDEEKRRQEEDKKRLETIQKNKAYQDLLNKKDEDKKRKKQEEFDRDIDLQKRRAALLKDDKAKELEFLRIAYEQEKNANQKNKKALILIEEKYRADKINLQKKYDDLGKEKTKEDNQKRLEDRLKNLDAEQKVIENAELQKVLNGEQTLQEMQEKSIGRTLLFLQKQKEILTEEGASTLEIDKQILDAKIKQNEDANKKILGQDKDNRDARLAVASETQNLLSSVADLAASKSGEMTDLQKGLALAQVAIDSGIALSNALATSTAPTPDNVASGGISGTVKYISLAASILSNIARAKKIIQGAGSGGASTPSSGGGASIPNVHPSSPAFSGVSGVALPKAPQEGRTQSNMRVYVTESDISSTVDRVNGIKTKAKVL